MTDPISIVGAAAAAVQFGDISARAVLESIKLLKNLKETPKRMTQQLQDVTKSIQRMLQLRSAILAPASPVFTRLTSQQRKRIDEAVSDADLAMKSLHQSLQHILPQQTSNTNNSIKSFWRAVVSVTREKDIEEKIQRITRLHQELMQELQVTDLELHTSTWNLNFLIFSTVETGLREAQANHDTRRISEALLQNTADRTESEVGRVRNDTASMATSIDALKMDVASLSLLADRTNHTVLATQQEIGGLRLEFGDFQRLFNAELDAKLLKEREHNRAEILSLRDALLKLMTGDDSKPLGQEIASAAYLPESSKIQLGIQVQNQLLHCPSVMRKIADHSMETVRRGFEPVLQCYCRPSTNLVTIRRGVVRIGHERHAKHNTNCPFYQSNARSWSYALTVRLLPFLNKTVALALSATFGAGAWAITPSLKFYATTERANSSLFSQFDSFARVCSRPRQPRAGFSIYKYWELEWDLERIVMYLDEMIMILSCNFENGSANGSDMDECGSTMLHEVLLLMTVLGPHCHSVTNQLHELLRLALLSGVDKFARTETFPLHYFDTRGYIVWVTPTDSPSLTAMEILLGQMFTHSFLQNETTVLDTIKCFELEDTFSWDNIIFDQSDLYAQREFVHRSENPLSFIRKYPEFATELDCGELVAPILRRSADELRCAIQSPSSREFLQRKMGVFHPLKVATGWIDGIKLLLEEKCFTIEAIELAICTNDTESLDIMLSKWSENPFDWWSEDMFDSWNITGLPSCYRMILERAGSSSQREIHQCAVRYLNKVLPKLSELSRKVVGEVEKTEPTVSAPQHSSCRSRLAYMQEEFVFIKPESPLDTSKISRYHFLDERRGATQLLDTLYASGDTAIDLKNRNQETPLLYRLSRLRNCFSDFVPEGMMWFLERGASPNFDAPNCWPNVYFYYPLAISSNMTSLDRLDSLPVLCRSLCDPLRTDGCQCYCSSQGCLSLHLTWTCKMSEDHRNWHYRNCIGRTRIELESLKDWARITGVQRCQMVILCAETCRREIFDRLGMAHTCCRIGLSWKRTNRELFGLNPGLFHRVLFSDDERERLQDEDGELKKQLNMIMKAYARMHEISSGNLEEFWEWWWQTLDEILPDLLPEERCRAGIRHSEDYEALIYEQERQQEIREKRAQREEDTLKNNGYSGLDFIDVIRVHFQDYLS